MNKGNFEKVVASLGADFRPAKKEIWSQDGMQSFLHFLPPISTRKDA